MKAERHEGKQLKYLTVVPDDYQESVPYPLIIMLHGFGANMNDLIGMISYLNQEPCIYVFPNAPIDLKASYSFDGYAWIDPPDQVFSIAEPDSLPTV